MGFGVASLDLGFRGLALRVLGLKGFFKFLEGLFKDFLRVKGACEARTYGLGVLLYGLLERFDEGLIQGGALGFRSSSEFRA